MVERLAPGDVVHEQGAGGAAVVAVERDGWRESEGSEVFPRSLPPLLLVSPPRDRPKRLLPRRVPDLQLDGLPIDLDGPRPELDADRQVMHGLEALVGELQQQAGLADAGVANDDVLEEVAVFVFIFPFFCPVLLL